MKMKLFAGLAVGLFIIGLVEVGNAAIVDINAKTNTTTNPVIMFFDAGTYDVTPIGVADGGEYNAWNAWIGGSNPPSNAGWLNSYSLSSDEFPAYTVSDNTTRYSTDLLALSNALGTSFTLSSAGNVNFFITDSAYWDNVGGISLDVNPVPIPAAFWLLGTGFIGIVGLRAKRKMN